MKTYAILFAVLFMGSYAKAQKSQKDVDIPPLEVHINATLIQKHFVWKSQQISTKNEKDLVRLYKYKNSRIKRALSFLTPKDKAKLT